MILANHLGMDDDEVLSYIIDGIPDVQLRDVARFQGFRTSQSLLQAFEEISLSGRNFMSNSDAKSDSKGDGGKRKYDKNDSGVKTKNDEKNVTGEKKESATTKRCFNCGQRDHLSVNYPMKERGTKCLGCGEYGHIAAKCLKKKDDAPKSSCVVTQTRKVNLTRRF